MTKTRSAFITALVGIVGAGAAVALAFPAQAAPKPGSASAAQSSEKLAHKRAEKMADAAKEFGPARAGTPLSAAAAAPADITPAHLGWAGGRIYGRATDGRLWYRDTTPGAGWKRYGAPVKSGPAAFWGIDPAEGFFAGLLARGNSNDLVFSLQKEGKPDDGWWTLGGNLSSAPALATDESHIYVVARGGDGMIWVRTWDDNATAPDGSPGDWLAWRTIGGRSTSAPSITAHPERGVLVSVRGTDGHIYQRDINSGGWAKLKSGVITSKPEFDIAWTNAGPVLSAGWRGAGNALFLEHQELGQIRAGGSLSNGPTIISWEDEAGAYHRETYVRGTDSAVWRYTDAGAGNGIWESLGGKFS